MVFSSLLFVYLFLALNLFIYSRAHKITTKNIIMLVFSLIFYSWGGPKYLFLLVGMTFISWIMALAISRYHDHKKALLIADCILQLGLLGIFKYTGFILGNIQSITGFPEVIPQIALPIGISFYTFQLLSYVVDVYRGDVLPQKKFWLLLLYASLFHQCIAGPIVRYQDVQEDILHRRPKINEIDRGIKRFCIGLAKKAILANGCAVIADTFLITDDLKALSSVSALGLWLGVLCFMLQIYLDFSAYSDMAIGMGLMIGFHYKENFNYPYIANSITEFWRRWHISLSTFFRDYVYIPLGGNRKGPARTIINLLIVWFLTGMWHGASWNYILWGLYFFIFLVLEKNFLLKKFARLPGFISHIYALVVIYFGWILFKFEDLSGLGIVLKGMFGLNGNSFSDMQVGLMFKNNVFFLIFAIIAVTPLLKTIRQKIIQWFKSRKAIPYPVYAYEIIVPVVLLLLSTMALVGNSYNPFLYFQF
ncbi:MAG: MBOAT family protein [Clostridiales bacterium]|nr:MBOAT family protein [Clostridiales bacterium]